MENCKPNGNDYCNGYSNPGETYVLVCGIEGERAEEEREIGGTKIGEEREKRRYGEEEREERRYGEEIRRGDTD